LVNSDDFKDKKLRIDDSCAHCSDRITVEVEHGRIAQLEPDTVYVQRGGG